MDQQQGPRHPGNWNRASCFFTQMPGSPVPGCLGPLLHAWVLFLRHLGPLSLTPGCPLGCLDSTILDMWITCPRCTGIFLRCLGTSPHAWAPFLDAWILSCPGCLGLFPDASVLSWIPASPSKNLGPLYLMPGSPTSSAWVPYLKHLHSLPDAWVPRHRWLVLSWVPGSLFLKAWVLSWMPGSFIQTPGYICRIPGSLFLDTWIIFSGCLDPFFWTAVSPHGRAQSPDTGTVEINFY